MLWASLWIAVLAWLGFEILRAPGMDNGGRIVGPSALGDFRHRWSVQRQIARDRRAARKATTL